ncbi:hypothetical protein E4U42_002689 [Claviceps africana]|uniref:Uncharacterized protein n=1 Tax=Claviceps africana TaxID=83212 RepID=A0A8K0J8E7_9HYPO|nr:hypothetical protein E4U42_002689 [Claviceps africana]
MGLRDVFKKNKDQTAPVGAEMPEPEEALRKVDDAPVDSASPATEFQFIRTDTTSQERIQPPDDGGGNPSFLSPKPSVRSLRPSLDVFRSGRDRRSSVSSQTSHSPNSPKRTLSERLHLRRSPASSEHVPQDLPDITTSTDSADQSQWEKRATMLVGHDLARRTSTTAASPRAPRIPASMSDGVSQMSLSDERYRPNSPIPSPSPSPSPSLSPSPSPNPGPCPSPAAVSSKAIDEDIQEAIRLHEEGSLAQSTELFGRLADPEGANNPLSQVLYGLALRHGWGCEPDLANAVKYLTAAASNSAAVEQLALQAGMTKGGAAKGELVMAIYELANCFRHGWGIEKDAFAARQYYETAANLGDTDAMNDAAWCFEHGFGGKKDKFTAARYYRLAERAGHKTMGNSWIWKDKYDPEQQRTRKKK